MVLVTETPANLPQNRETGTSGERWFWLVFVLIIILAAAARIPGCFSDFWLDEIWALSFSLKKTSFYEIFTDHYSLNHYLHTAIIYIIGEREHWVFYRIHSLVSGIATVIIAWLIARRYGRVEAVIVMVLVAGSYPLIHYSSESKGYAMLVLFALATYYATLRFTDHYRWHWAVAVWLCTGLGFLAHLTYINVFNAVALWLIVCLLRSHKTKAGALVRFVQCYGVPLLFTGFLYFFAIRRYRIGGGASFKLPDVLVKTGSLTGGGPSGGPAAVAVALMTAVALLGAIIWMWRRRRDEWLLFLVVIAVSPAAVLLIKQADVLVPRYFLVAMAFTYIAIGALLSQLFRKYRWGSVVVVAVILLYLAGQAVHVASLLRYGRGGYRKGLHYMVEQTAGPVITIASFHEFRNQKVLEFYSRYLPADKRIELVHRPYSPSKVPNWLLLHRIGRLGKVQAVRHDPYGNEFVLEKTLPYSDLSGWHWLIYRKQRRDVQQPD